MELESIGEFGLIDMIGEGIFAPEHIIQGIGDDCAVLPYNQEYDQLVTCDMLNEGIHFLLDKTTPYQLGYKSVATSLSDIAAMGGEPTNIVISIGLTKQTSVQWWQAFYAGVQAICGKYRVNIAGGDTTRSESSVCINVTALGLVKKGQLHLRSDAQPGDIVFITGTLGGSRAGLELLQKRALYHNCDDILLKKHLQPDPCCQEIHDLNHINASAIGALNDISDGLVSECYEIAKASQVGIVIDSQQIPILAETIALAKRSGNEALQWALYGGEDYQLVGTLRRTKAWEMMAAYEAQCGQKLYAIGEVISDGGVYLRKDAKIVPTELQGYRHF